MPFKDKEAHKAWRRQRVEENVEFMRQYKVEQGCADCGYNEHHAGLFFDHLPGFEKEHNLGGMYHHSRSKILEEISKCEVVCGRCHGIRTWERQQNMVSMV